MIVLSSHVDENGFPTKSLKVFSSGKIFLTSIAPGLHITVKFNFKIQNLY